MGINTEGKNDHVAEYLFTVDWFSAYRKVWDQLLPQIAPRSVIEIGSYEGRSTCYLIEKCATEHPLDIHCIDTWSCETWQAKAVPHNAEAMMGVEQRFDHNVAIAQSRAKNAVTIVKHKMLSTLALAKLIAITSVPSFDMIYIDGSHQAVDVLTDAIMSFQLLRVGGLMIFDDYLYHAESFDQHSPLLPKPAIDAFLNIFQRKMRLVPMTPLYQLYAMKYAR